MVRGGGLLRWGWAGPRRQRAPARARCSLPTRALDVLPAAAAHPPRAGAHPPSNQILAVKIFQTSRLADAQAAQLREATVVMRDVHRDVFVRLRGAYLGDERERRPPALLYDLANGSSLDSAAR